MNQLGKRLSIAACAGVILVVGALAFTGLCSTPAGALSESEKDEIKTLVREYLIENPDILQEMVVALEASRNEQEQLAAQQGIKEHREALFNGDPAFVGGNPEGSITLVEFFDYRCGYCKRAVKDLQKVMDENPDLRVVFKEYPVLGADSVMASRAGIAAANQGRYTDFHFALMATEGPVNEDAIFEVAGNIGIDVEQLRSDMKSEAVDRALEANFELAQALKINGTPNFIIGDQILPGAQGFKAMTTMIADIRENGCAVC